MASESKEASKAAETAEAAQKKADELSKAAENASDPAERQRLLNEATKKQMDAYTSSKTAKRLQSGTLQGLIAGTGVGVGIGAGLGTVTGAIVGGVSSVAVGGLGAAIGSGVGAIHGPFVKMPTSEQAARAVDNARQKGESRLAGVVESGRQATGAVGASSQFTASASDQSPKPKKKPRKLEVRS